MDHASQRISDMEIFKIDYVLYISWWELHFLIVLNVSDDHELHLVLLAS